MANKNKVINRILTTLIVILVFAAIILLLIDPIKNMKRKEIVEEAVVEIKTQITAEVPEITYVVNKNDVKIEGEEVEFFGTPEEQEEQRKEFEEAYNSLTDNVTLNCIGLIEIDSIGQCDPIWDNDTVIDLRYGIGHHQTSVLPGEEGNCTLLGHHMRAYGSMFNRLGEMEVGDNIRVRTVGGHVYNYVVDEVIIVPASELNLHIGNNKGGEDEARITLVTCTYTSSGTQRLLVMGHLVND